MRDGGEDEGGMLVESFDGEAEGSDASFAQPCVAASVGFGAVCMGRSIEFDAEVCFGAVEIEDVGAEGVLAAEVEG